MAISFEVGDDLQDVVCAVEAFALEQVRPRLREAEQEGLSPQLARALFELGLCTLALPESLGGLDELDVCGAALVSEALAWGDLGVAAAAPGPRSAGACVLELASAELAERLLAPFADEEEGWRRSGTLAWAEGPFGVDPDAIEATARREGEAWVLSGTKRYVWAGERAALTLVLARDAGSQAPDPWDRLVLLPVVGRAGLRAEEPATTLGLNAASYVTLHLDGARVPLADRLGGGAPGEVRRAVRRTIARKRVLDAACLVGCMRAACDHAFRYATERQAFGVYLYEHQALAFMMADMATAADAARNLVLRAGAALDAGEEEGVALAERALRAAQQHAREVTSDAVQVLGGHGYIQDHPVEKWMRDARTLGLVEGLSLDEDGTAL